MKIKPKHQTITINQLEWVLGPLVINGEHLITYQEAKDYADKNGLKLPTKKQFEDLINIDKIYDKIDNGVWINPYNISKECINSENSLFLSYLGYIDMDNNLKEYQDCAVFWAGDQSNSLKGNPYHLIYNSGMSYVNGYDPSNYKFQALFIL